MSNDNNSTAIIETNEPTTELVPPIWNIDFIFFGKIMDQIEQNETKNRADKK